MPKLPNFHTRWFTSSTPNTNKGKLPHFIYNVKVLILAQNPIVSLDQYKLKPKRELKPSKKPIVGDGEEVGRNTDSGHAGIVGVISTLEHTRGLVVGRS